ncbi:hypothetical protein [Pseudooceanicola antarcticus]|uniref:Uncharacterized protein n=2 Tax=Pseudooceanicola antarcticus TaxID=1247613 RepID=A0ABX4MRW2_9RHOB|nr:hypothetical protein [Pseudooceanicola antarcticus]PJE31385.1 hypothetical protein CVM39_04035 [Pseudooceanicola antarcticus]
MLQGGVLDSEIRMRILHTRCPDDDGLCHIAQDLALGVSSNAMIVDLLCGRPIALPPSMDAPSDQQAMDSGLLEAVAACIAPPGTLAEDPDPSSAPETNRPVGSLATTLTVAVPEPFQPNPNATCLSTEEAARLYGDRFLLQSIQASPLCGTSADCAREILSATDRIRSRTERGAILTGQQQEADRIAASCIAQPELEWAVNRLRSQFFFGPRPWLGSPEISDEPSIGPPAFDYELPIIGELGPVLPELQVPQSPIDGLPGPMPVPAEILSPDLRAYTTFAASDSGIDAFRATFCSLDPPALPDVPMPQR